MKIKEGKERDHTQWQGWQLEEAEGYCLKSSSLKPPMISIEMVIGESSLANNQFSCYFNSMIPMPTLPCNKTCTMWLIQCLRHRNMVFSSTNTNSSKNFTSSWSHLQGTRSDPFLLLSYSTHQPSHCFFWRLFGQVHWKHRNPQRGYWWCPPALSHHEVSVESYALAHLPQFPPTSIKKENK